MSGSKPSRYVEINFFKARNLSIFGTISLCSANSSKTDESVEYPVFVFLITGSPIFSNKITPNCFVELILKDSPAKS